jgi:hypothetical protein
MTKPLRLRDGLQAEREPVRGPQWAAVPVPGRQGACMLEQPPAADLLGLCGATDGDRPRMRCRTRAWLQLLARRLFLMGSSPSKSHLHRNYWSEETEQVSSTTESAGASRLDV